MDEISDTNDNKNHKVSFIELIDSSEKTTKTMDSDSSWIEFQGNNNNLNEKTVLRNLNCGAGSVGGRTTENCANFLTTITTTVATAPPTAATETTTITTTSDVDLTLGPILQQQNQQKILTNGSEYYDSTAMTMRSPPQKSLANDDDHNGVNYLSPYEMDNNGIKTSPDDTDADEPSENNSTDNLSFNSEDGNIGLIDDIVLLPNNLISEDELSTNSDDCVYAYRGADFDPIPANPEDENDFLEMDFEPDPASEIEQDNNLLLNNGLNVINSFEHAAASAINAIDAMDFGLGIKNGAIEKSLYGDSIALNGRNDFSGSPTNNLLNQRIDNVSTADKCNIDKSHCMEEFQRKINENGAVPSTSNCIGDGCGNGLLNGATAVAQPSYYDNIVVSLSTKKYTGTIPKTSRTTNGARTIRHKMAAKDSANKTGNSDAELKCRECAEKCLQQSSSSMRNEQREANECKRCQALQTFSCMRNGFDVNTSLDIGSSSTSAQQPIPKNGLNKRSMSFPVVNRHENGYTESTDNIEGTSYPPSRFYGSSDPNHYDEQNGHRLDPFGFYETHETDSSRIPENSVSIYSICFTEDIIVDALGKINVTPNIDILREQLRPQFLNDPTVETTMNIPEYLIHISKQNCDFKALMAAIELSCPNDSLDITFIPFDIQPETVQIPVREILNRVPINGSLKNVLNIRNKQFHKMNVLGKIVNALRKFSDMRHDINKENYITIPQYYRSGYVYISRRQPCPKESL